LHEYILTKNTELSFMLEWDFESIDIKNDIFEIIIG